MRLFVLYFETSTVQQGCVEKCSFQLSPTGLISETIMQELVQVLKLFTGAQQQQLSRPLRKVATSLKGGISVHVTSCNQT